MNECEIIDFAAETGLCLLENGAETYRTEDTIERIISHYTEKTPEVIVVLTGITISVGSDTKAVRVRKHQIHLNRIVSINQMSRDISENKITFQQAKERLKQIQKEKPYPFAVKSAAFGICCSFFTLLFEGCISDAINGFLTGVILNFISKILSTKTVPPFLVTLAGGATVSLPAIIIKLCGIGENIDATIIGSIMPLVPGTGLVNALRDLSQGDYQSGGARFFEAITTALAVAVGAGGIMQLWRCFT